MHQNTAILEAIESGDLEAFKGLVGQDATLRNGRNAFGSWLHCACSEGQLALVKYLVENGADINLRGGTGDAGPIDFAAGISSCISSRHLAVVLTRSKLTPVRFPPGRLRLATRPI